MKKIKITIAGNDRTAIILPVECAGFAAELLARAMIYERDGYHTTSGWKKAESGVHIEYTDAAELEPTHPSTVAAQEDAARSKTMWVDEYNKRQALEKELSEARAQIEAIKSVTTCTVADPEPVATDDAPEVDDL